jgi:uronate dehydrogenase
MILITGAAGRIGSCLAAGLPALGHRLRLLDAAPIPDTPHETVTGDVNDPEVLAAATKDVTAVVHLAGNPSATASFEDLLPANVEGAYRVFEAARRAGAERVVYASSNHAVGFTPRSASAGVDVPVRPDSLYGVTKAYGEALGRYYADRYGLRVASLRIGSFAERPRTPRMLSTWLSHGDMVRLAHACLTSPDLTHAVVYGVSANTRGWWDLEPGRAIGYDPQDDAETYVAGSPELFPELDPDDPEYAWLGGVVVES